jgi:molybdate transport system permease protein
MMDWQAIALSLRLAATTTLILGVLGLPAAWWLATSRWRFRFLIEAVIALPLVLPPTVLGFYALLALGPKSPLGRGLEQIVGHRLPFSFSGLLMASLLYSLPFAVQPFMSAFATVERRWLEASRCLGVGEWNTFRRIALPLAWPGILSGLVLCFAHALGEFGVVLMVGGNIAGETRTVSVAIYDHAQALDYTAAHRAAGLMLGFAFFVLSLTYALQRRLLHPSWKRN